jgi:transposase
VARREDVCTSLVYKWWRAAQREARAAVCGFSSVIIEPAPRVATSQEQPPQEAAAGVVEVELNDAPVKIGATAPSSVIAAALKAPRS